jgi:hypothetical protein
MKSKTYNGEVRSSEKDFETLQLGAFATPDLLLAQGPVGLTAESGFNYLSTGILTAPQLKPVKAARCHGAQGRNLQSLFLRPKVFITNCGIRVKSLNGAG